MAWCWFVSIVNFFTVLSSKEAENNWVSPYQYYQTIPNHPSSLISVPVLVLFGDIAWIPLSYLEMFGGSMYL